MLNKSKFPAITRERVIAITETLEGNELKRHETRRIRVEGWRKNYTYDNDLEENLELEKQLIEAHVYYGDLAEIPYFIDVDDTPFKTPLYEYFSRMRMLKPSSREERRKTYQEIAHLLKSKNLEEWKLCLQGVKKAEKPSSFDAEDVLAEDE